MNRLFRDIDLHKITYGKYRDMYLRNKQQDFEKHYKMFLMYCAGNTLKQIADEYDLTEQRIRQIFIKVHRRLKMISERG
jgi:DNA-directed RNA polymerase sigma subunit (sigma70/sigma32)